MEEDLAKKLSNFGLTVNQAKVYLNIVQHGLTHVSRISESTKLHRQDIYKILPKLEKMGLIARTIDKPIIIEAIPIEKALNNLISIEREEANEKISRLETNLKKLVNAIRERQEREKTEGEEARFILLTTDEQIMNSADLAFENTKKECDLVTNLELLTRRMDHFHENFQKLSRKGVKIKVIVEKLDNGDLVKKALEKIKPDNGDFAAKLISKSVSLPYRIIDNKELFIRRKKTTESGLPCVLWTNSKNVVKFYKENFERVWHNSRAISVYPKRDLQRELAKAQKGHETLLKRYRFAFNVGHY
jgi:sugar-specific transcriptional regulator TrmB